MQQFKNNVGYRLRTRIVDIGYCSKPGFLVIGTQKGGTSALYRYLSEHPNIVLGRKKEIGFFDRDVLYNKGDSWYHNHFPLPHKLGAGRLTFEATPEYLYYPKAAQRIFSYNPNIKLIVSLRDPVKRAFSSWNMFRSLRINHPDYLRSLLPDCDPDTQTAINSILLSDPFPEFDQVVRDEIEGITSGDYPLEPGYVRRGIYYEQLLRYFQCFDPTQIFVIDCVRLKNDTSTVLDEITRFLGLPEYSWPIYELSLTHVGQYETRLDDKTRAMLQEFYRPYNEKVFELLGRSFDWQACD